MKIAKRIVLGLFGTVALTSFILFALDAYLANQAASHSAVQTNADTLDKANAGSGPDAAIAKNSLQTKDEKLSISTSERQMLYQPQETMPFHTKDVGTAASFSTKDADTAASSSTKNTDTAEPSKTAASGKNKTASDQSADQPEQKKQSGKSDGSKNGQASDKKRNSFQTVTKDYFSDALFIGDSRTVGMQQSQLLPGAAYYAKTGIGIGDILSERIVNEGGTMISVADALRRHSFGKVYIMIGINDIARGDVDWFTTQYKKILETIQQTQKDAIIYIQGNIPMSYGTQDLNGALNNKNLSLRNEASRALADSENIFYLDINEIYADANGHLAGKYTRDGLHVSPTHYPLWVNYLLEHAIVRD